MSSLIGTLGQMSEKVTAPKIRAMKGQSRIVCLTAYDVSFARIADQAGVDLILVGDSLGNVVMGYDTTVQVTLEAMIHHTRCVARGISRAMLVADMPFGSYGASVGQAVESAVALVRAGAQAVKLEGDFVDEVRAIQRVGIPVMGHVGFTPQSVHQFGGYRVQGRDATAEHVSTAAKRLEESGVFATVLELVPGDVATRITSEISNPSIGIGAGAGCDGQIQVLHDVLGLERKFKHAKAYVDGRTLSEQAIAEYAREVRSGDFPTEENTF